VRELGHDCTVVAPALIPKRSGERVKTNRRDAITLARLHRAGELPGAWVPDVVHEAVRDLIRAREAAADDLRRKRRQLLSFLLRRGRIYDGGSRWTLAHRRWLAGQAFERAWRRLEQGQRACSRPACCTRAAVWLAADNLDQSLATASGARLRAWAQVGCCWASPPASSAAHRIGAGPSAP
jgi:transposase